MVRSRHTDRKEAGARCGSFRHGSCFVACGDFSVTRESCRVVEDLIPWALAGRVSSIPGSGTAVFPRGLSDDFSPLSRQESCSPRREPCKLGTREIRESVMRLHAHTSPLKH